MSAGVVFLMYHELELPGRSLCKAEPGYVRYILRKEDFEAQLNELQRTGWRGVSVSEALRSYNDKTVAITFDDGCETDLLYAAPLLKARNFGGTFYLTTGFLGKPGYLSHAQVRELSGLGFEIGCHSMTHPYLTNLNGEDLQREIAGAKVQLEQILGSPVEHFSCPGGRHNQQVSEVAREAGYRTVATSRIQVNSRNSNPMALGRVAVMRSTSLATFGEICNGRNLWQMSLQVQLRAATKKLLGNSFYDRLRSIVLRDSIL
jgi:peptidoglycan/xylan/chitin deacetylase (PgdA/CDA1 family)